MKDYLTNPTQEDWNFVMQNSSMANITQSWEYGEVMEKLGYTVLKIILYQNGKPVSAMLGTYKYKYGAPSIGLCVSGQIVLGSLGGGAPVIVDGLGSEVKKEIFIKSLKVLEKVARRKRILKVSIHTPLSHENFWDIYKSKNYLVSEEKYTPIIDIEEDINILWKNLHKKHRNAIRNTESKGVSVVKNNEAFEEYWNLAENHMKLKNYTTSPYLYQKTFFEYFSKKNMCELFFSKQNGEYVSGAFIWKYKDMIYYVYGVSTEKSWEIQANNLIHWEIIKNAQKEKYKLYNMWGGRNEEAHLPTRFKMRFSKDAQLMPVVVFRKILFF